MAAEPEWTYFAEESVLGLGRLLRRGGRRDVVHPGLAELPEVPLGTPDLGWLRIVAAGGWIVLTRDRPGRSRSAELAAYSELGIRSVWIGARRDLGPTDQASLFLRHEPRLRQQLAEPGPAAVTLHPSGLSPLLIHPRK